MQGTKGMDQPTRTAGSIVAVYAAVGTLWILVSDSLVNLFLPEASGLAQLIKGEGFIAVSATALFLLLRHYDRRTHRLFAALSDREAHVSDLNGFLETVIDNSRVLICAMDVEGRTTMWNCAAEEITGYNRDEVVGHARIWEWLYPDPAHRRWIVERVAPVLRGERELTDLDVTCTIRDGRQRTLRWQARPLFKEDGRPAGAVTVGLDVTERLAAETARNQSEQRMATLLANLPGMAYRCAPDSRWTMHFVSQGSRTITGYAPEELRGNRVVAFGDLIHPEDQNRVHEAVALAVSRHQPFEVEYRLRTRQGEERWVWEQGRPVPDGEECVLEGIMLDISERKRMEEELMRVASHDPLTGLLTRRELESRLTNEVDRALRYERPLGLILLDVDRFKDINDSQGHAAGDAALRQVGHLIRQSLRDTDFAARYGGDELVIVAPETEHEHCLELAERLRALVAEDTRSGSPLTISLGVAALALDAHTTDDLLQAADRALYRAKSEGRNRVAAS